MSFIYHTQPHGVTHVQVATQIDPKVYAELKAIDPQRSTARLVREAIECYVARLQRPHFVCPECGPLVSVDEDGCCAMCGADCEMKP